MVQDLLNLRWCIGSAPLLKHYSGARFDLASEQWCADMFDRDREWFEALQLKPGAIEAFVDHGVSGPIPLGKRFERYLLYWFTHSSSWQMVCHGLQVKHDQHTLGEYDFVVRDLDNGEVIHVEVACKFYLSVSNVRQHRQWVGPSGRDRLDVKVETLARQVQLSRTREGEQALRALGVQQVTPLVLLKGFFFYHFSELTRARAPFGAHDRHNAGWWAYERESDRLFAGDGTWVLLPKSDWLASVHVDFSDDRLMSARQMPRACREYITANGRAVMVAQLDLQNGVWTELSRGCIVMNRWPRIG